MVDVLLLLLQLFFLLLDHLTTVGAMVETLY